MACHFQKGFVISTFPLHAGQEGLSPSLPSPGWVLGWPLWAGSPRPPSPVPFTCPSQAPQTPLGASGNQTATARCPFQLPKRAASLQVWAELAASTAGSTSCTQAWFARLFPASRGEGTRARVGGCLQGDAGHGERRRCVALCQRRAPPGWAGCCQPRPAESAGWVWRRLALWRFGTGWGAGNGPGGNRAA